MAGLEAVRTGSAELVRMASGLALAHDGASAEQILRAAILRHFQGRIALVSSFGAESAVLLALVAEVDRATPVVFIDTGKLFGETLRYRDALVARLGLTDVRSIGPDAGAAAKADPQGALWLHDPDACCALRKVAPLDRALAGFDAWITGRKRFQASSRAGLQAFESDGRHIKVNPLADWTPGDVARFIRERGLPAHPLVSDGYLSIGCMPCTSRVADGEDPRAGRWRGRGKIECGIHLAPAARRAPEREEETVMTLFRGGAFVRDVWMRLADDAQVPSDGAILLSHGRWSEEAENLRARVGPVAVEIDGGAPLDAILPHLAHFDMIAVRFPKFSDGRGYSTIRLLRDRHGFRGEIRATGDILLDQIPFLRRVGATAFEIAHEPTRAALARGHLPEVSVRYQPASVPGEDTVRALRVALRRDAA